MEVTFLGVRGSVAAPGPLTVRHGGNTACVEVRAGSGTRVLLDAGTGIRSAAPGEGDVWLFLSHTHWDHVQGLPFFAPLHDPGRRLRVLGPRWAGHRLDAVLAATMTPPLFPVPLTGAGADLAFQELDPGEAVDLPGGVTVRTARLNHPAPALAYRIEADGAAFVYATDTAPWEPVLLVPGEVLPPGEGLDEARRRLDREWISLLAGADLVVVDTMFTEDEWRARPTWGHGTAESALEACRRAGARALALFHHSPERTDDEVDALLAAVRGRAGEVEVTAASEGRTVRVEPPSSRTSSPGPVVERR